MNARMIEGPVAVIGGSGFIGSNLAASFLEEGRDVLVLDNLSRPGVEQNLAWLQLRFGARVHPRIVDVRDLSALRSVLADAAVVYNFAAQTAVTTSLEDPLGDFETNARGAINVLEAVRLAGRGAPVIFSSTNKVYGDLDDVAMEQQGQAHRPVDSRLHAHGVGEDRPLHFCTPYGCSKGVADQYVLDYAKSFGLPTAVLRMSCIYGPRQFGTEDQGWVAHFLIKALQGDPITIYGDGRQVRDVLHVDDAVAAYRGVLDNIARLSGQVFNLGGGPRNAVSLREVIREIGDVVGREVTLKHGEWRKGDQLWFVADTRRLEQAVGWRAAISWREGVRDLAEWLIEARPLQSSRRERLRA